MHAGSKEPPSQNEFPESCQKLLRALRSSVDTPLAERLNAFSRDLYLKNPLSFHTLRNYLSDLRTFFDFFRNDLCTYKIQGDSDFARTRLPAMGSCSPSLSISKESSSFKYRITLADFNALSRRDMRAFFSDRHMQGTSHRALSRTLSSLRAFAKFLQTHENITDSCLFTLRTPRFTKSLPRPLAQDAARAISQPPSENTPPSLHSLSWQELRNRALFTLLYGTGLRISEALSLRLSDLAQADHTPTVRVLGKRQIPRLVVILPAVLKAIRTYLEASPWPQSPESPLFRGVRGGSLSPGIFQKYMQALRRSQGWSEHITPHSLRHSFASHLFAGGAELRAIQELLGHRSLDSTQIYTHLATDALAKRYQAAHPMMQPNTPSPLCKQAVSKSQKSYSS